MIDVEWSGEYEWRPSIDVQSWSHAECGHD